MNTLSSINAGSPEEVIIDIHNGNDLTVMQFGITSWLEVMSDCRDRLDTYCTLAGRTCEYAKCPGNNMQLGGE